MIIPVEQLRNVCAAPKRSNGTREGVLSMEWIKRKDQVPKFDENVLLYDTFGQMNVGCLVQHENGFVEWFIGVEWLGLSDVTHWMPLPEPPKQI